MYAIKGASGVLIFYLNKTHGRLEDIQDNVEHGNNDPSKRSDQVEPGDQIDPSKEDPLFNAGRCLPLVATAGLLVTLLWLGTDYLARVFTWRPLAEDTSYMNIQEYT